MRFLMKNQRLFQLKFKALNTKHIADFNHNKNNLNIQKTLFNFQTRQLTYHLSNKKYINKFKIKIMRLYSKSIMNLN